MKNLKTEDREIADLIVGEEIRQREVLEMVPSENYTSPAVREAVGSILMDKYAEGLPGKRYYQGNRIIDEIENLAVARFKKLFGVPYINVQPYSGSPANSAVYFALLNPGEKIMGLALASGGHLTHGHPRVTFSGKYFSSVQYAVEDNGWIDYGKLEKLVAAEKPQIIVCGTTAYPRFLDFAKFSKIGHAVGAYVLADISHLAGLIIAGVHPSPVPFADIVMTTTHKTLRGPRGAVIMVTETGLRKDPELGEKIDKAVFPGLQGGPHENIIAGIAVCAKEASNPEFKKYGEQVVQNAKALAENLLSSGLELVSGGTDNHLMVIDLRKKKLLGNVAAAALEEAGIVTNKNAVPGDPLPPFYASGIRLGTPAITSRGMKEGEMKIISRWVGEVINFLVPYPDLAVVQTKESRSAYSQKALDGIKFNRRLKEISGEVKNLCQKFPVN